MTQPAELAAAAARYHAALTAGLALAGSCSLADGPTAGELLLEASFGAALRPALVNLYRRPIADGLAVMMKQSREEIVRSTLAYYREHQELIESLQAQLRQYAGRGFDLGGQMGLDELALEGQFQLTDEGVLETIDAHVGRLVDSRRGAQLSAVVTTAEELGREVSRRRDDGLTVTDLLPVLSAWLLGRAAIRSALIAETETVRMTRWGAVWAFAGNGIHGVRHECESDVTDKCRGALCPPLCGTEYELGGVLDPMSGIPAAGLIPLHPRCRCFYSPLRDGWLKPALIWTGFALDALDD